MYATIGAMRASPGDWTSDDKGVLTLEYADGSVATVVTCHVALPDRFELLLHGTRGNLDVQLSALTRYDRSGTVDTEEWPERGLLDVQLEHTLACIDGTETPVSGLAESMDLQCIVEAAYRSAASHRPVDLDELEHVG